MSPATMQKTMSITSRPIMDGPPSYPFVGSDEPNGAEKAPSHCRQQPKSGPRGYRCRLRLQGLQAVANLLPIGGARLEIAGGQNADLFQGLALELTAFAADALMAL